MQNAWTIQMGRFRDLQDPDLEAAYCVRWRPECGHFAGDVLIWTDAGPALLPVASVSCHPCRFQWYAGARARRN